jgi:hypothetical protein
MRGDAFWTQLLDLVQYTDYCALFADPTRPEPVLIEPFSYIIDYIGAANTINKTPMNFLTPMTGDCDFLMTGMAGFAQEALGGPCVVNPTIQVQITDLSSARTFFAGPAPMPFIAGQMGFPYLLTGPRTVKARATLKTSVSVLATFGFNSFFWAFHGAKIWYP